MAALLTWVKFMRNYQKFQLMPLLPCLYTFVTKVVSFVHDLTGNISAKFNLIDIVFNTSRRDDNEFPIMLQFYLTPNYCWGGRHGGCENIFCYMSGKILKIKSHGKFFFGGGEVMVFNATFKNISVISWRISAYHH
jgi:hypothetical protein